MSKTILVVDDSRLTLDIISVMLASAGFKVMTAANGLEALEVLSQEAIDAVIVDVNMPVMDGYALTRKIRADNVLASIPVIMITTESGVRDMAKGFEAGANAYLVKPVSVDEMVAQLTLLTASS